MNAEDQHDISECLDGDTEAFGRLVVRYQDRLFNTLSSMLGSMDDARDAAQEAFVHAFQKLSSFRGQSAFYSWLFRIALNAAVSLKRKEKREKSSLDQAREQAGFEPEETHAETQPAELLETGEQHRLVREAIAELPEDYRTVLVLKEMEGMKYEEIAKAVGCPVGTVRSRIHRARAELREKLKALLGE